MLDENMRATIVDFWYSIFLPPGQEALYVDFDTGRKYSRDPDYEKTGKLKRESDVYSFGVLLFEMLCGRTADDPIYLEENVKGLGPVENNIDKLRRLSLDRYLDDASLTWMRRLNICIDVASALGFLHEGVGKAKVIHGDTRTTNILVNHDWKAKLADFRLSLISPRNQESSDVIGHVCGTVGFLTKESDIYSFGVVLFEILCGRSTLAIHKYEGHYLPDFIRNNFEKGKHDEIVFEQIKDQIVPKSLTMFQTIAYQCLYREKEKRPTAKEVLVQLKKALEFQEQGQCQNVEQKMHQVDERPPKTLELQGNNLEYLKIPLTDITLATNNFFKTYRIPSWDAYNLYRAKLDHFDKENPSHVEGEHPKRHNTVIIKRYPEGHDLFTKEAFFTEIEILTSVKHPNIITLLGFCIESSEMILVTENVPNGYLDSYLGNLNKMSILTWERRLRICIDVACALSYLHFEVEDQKTIVNRNISSGSIGLDENGKAKISDFGLSAYLSPNQDNNKGLSLKSPVGSTRFYIDPTYVKSGKLKRELDVYSFGVVLFEILCGRKAFDPIYKGSGNDLASMVRQNFCAGTLEDMIDPIIKEETSESKFLLNKGPNKDSLNTFIEIAHRCVAEAEDERPSMKVVVEKLKKALFFQKNNKDNPRISLEDIKLATNNFHDSNCVGGGGFGGVYKGKLQDGDGFKTIVAKRLDRKLGQGEQQFSTELQILLEYKHENVIGLVGYYDEEDEKVIVYEYASRGSLDRYLGNASLTWVERLHICIDVASALYFLHSGVGRQAKVIHRDIKTPNILLNHEWKAKLGDFGLSLISPIIQDKDYVIDRACGTRGYLDPLYRKSGFLTIESDIYSFGVVLFEILCGRSTNAIRKHEGEFLSGFVKNRFEDGKLNEVVFEHIRKEIKPKSLLTFQEIAYKCLHHERENRPTTRVVLMQLKKALELQNMTSTMTNFASLKIPLENVVKATQDFHHDNAIRHDEHSTTYRGRLSWSGRLMTIAARRFDCKNAEADLKFLTELSVLYDLKHTNLVSIIGFCEEKEEKIIITTYETKGSLAQYLNNSNLTWTQRLRIGVGVARALSYLLYDEGRNYAVIHCNINSDTILLDENWEAKLSGFEYSVKQLVYHKDQVCLCEHIDTMGRMDPAIEKTGGVTQMSDIYSLGVVLFEILCGRKAFMQNDANKFLAPWAKYHFENRKLHDIIHHDLFSNQMSPQSLLKHTNVAYSCLNEDRAQRPDMDVIVEELEKALELQLRVEEKIGQNLERLKIRLILPSNQEETLYLNKYVRRRPYIDPEYAKTETQTQRPTMNVVVKKLKKALSFQILKDK
ncbi:hypothetical protein QVD17_39815 [Tagetes erecta]|uniref:Protein kinase domain-containing protein n=1 Tax=Tagetes erecta TaxID=13708 RepID=A0AAD8NAG2_TARER|nr:hypothetical protein QVD17_39815 [Tagetes erecta]